MYFSDLAIREILHIIWSYVTNQETFYFVLKGYNRCIDAFIEHSQKGAFLRNDVFEDIPPLCAKTNKLINEVFTTPEVVMAKLVLNIYTSKLQVNVM